VYDKFSLMEFGRAPRVVSSAMTGTQRAFPVL